MSESTLGETDIGKTAVERPDPSSMKEEQKSKHTGFGVALEAQHNLGRSVPPGSHILSHVPRILFGVHGEATGQTKIANLELAVCINEQVTGLEITVEHIG